MSKLFRTWKIDQTQLLPPSVQDYVPDDHLSRFIVALVRESLDLSAITGRYKGGLGQPPFDPAIRLSQSGRPVLDRVQASGVGQAATKADPLQATAKSSWRFKTIFDNIRSIQLNSDFRWNEYNFSDILFRQKLCLCDCNVA